MRPYLYIYLHLRKPKTPKMATIPSHALRHLTLTRPWLRKISCTTSLAFSSQDPLLTYPDNSNNNDTDHTKKTTNSKSQAFFPKKNQVLELECESLAFKGKGVCKVADSGFVLLCDNALPGERFIGRVSRKKGSYAEVNDMHSHHSLHLVLLIRLFNLKIR